MSEPTSEGPTAESRDRRGDSRRGEDRRRPERRASGPIWRRPWAYLAYGVLGAFLIVALMRMFDDDEPALIAEDIVSATSGPSVDTSAANAANAPPREALSAGEYERLLAQGDAVVGQKVVTVLFCEEVNSISLSANATVGESIAALADANQNVPGAECRWGDGPDAPELVLLVPPDLAPRFAGAPEVVQGFIRRRRVRAEVEWIGRSDALALRNVAVLRQIQ